MTVQDLADLNAKIKAAGIDPNFVFHHEGKEVDIVIDLHPVDNKLNITITKKF